MTKNKLRGQRDWPQKPVDYEPDYYTGAEHEGDWIVAPSMDASDRRFGRGRGDRPIFGGPVLCTNQLSVCVPEEALVR